MTIPVPVMQRLLARITIDPDTECWEFQGCRLSSGYGRIGIGPRLWLTHRVSYLHLVGPIPDGLELDHLCKNKCCCNPDHLEPVTRKVNIQRGTQAEASRRRGAAITHCPRGHEYTPENTYYVPKTGDRQCQECKRLANNRYAARPDIRQKKLEYARAYRANQAQMGES